MGSLSLAQLLGVEPDDMDAAHEIGGLPNWHPCTAMCLGSAHDNPDELIYLGKTPIRVSYERRSVTCDSGKQWQ